MGCLTLDKIDSKMLKRLQSLAKKHNKTLEDEVIYILQQAVDAGAPADKPTNRAGDLALRLFGSENGIELDLPARTSHNPPDFSE